MNDILLIDKPAGVTSFGVVARVRRKLSEAVVDNTGSQKKARVKVGHTGTLDPFATGLMILLIGKETKRSNEFLKLDKVYEATIRLGQVSSTGDPEGEITDVSATSIELPSRTELEVALKQFVGEIEQTPPVYSAIKIDGERAYKRARKGEVIEMPSRHVVIHSLELLEYKHPEFKIRTHVSSGTYIRTLAEDIGRVLGVGAYCRELRRTRVAEYSVEQALSLEDLGILS